MLPLLNANSSLLLISENQIIPVNPPCRIVQHPHLTPKNTLAKHRLFKNEHLCPLCQVTGHLPAWLGSHPQQRSSGSGDGSRGLYSCVTGVVTTAVTTTGAAVAVNTGIVTITVEVGEEIEA